MKKILILAAVVFSGMLFSCVSDVDDAFDTSAAQRIQETIDAHRKVLTSNQDGWLMSMYAMQSYGGYNVLVKFNSDGKVTVSSDITKDADSTYVSTFDVLGSRGPVLTFDTYNDIFHYFSDPELTIGAGRGTGLGGDFEFVIMEATANYVKLKGTKTGNTIHMVPFKGDSWNSYLEDVLEVRTLVDNKLFANYTAEIAGSPIKFTVDDLYQVMYYPDESDPDGIAEFGIAFRFTDTGIQFYEPITVRGVTLQDFTWDQTEGSFVSVSNPSIILTGGYNEGFIHYDEYLGSYVLTSVDINGNPQAATTATLEVDEVNSTYKLNIYDSAVRYSRTIILNYSKSTSDIYFYPQSMGNYVYGSYGSTEHFAFCCGVGGYWTYFYDQFRMDSDVYFDEEDGTMSLTFTNYSYDPTCKGFAIVISPTGSYGYIRVYNDMVFTKQ